MAATWRNVGFVAAALVTHAVLWAVMPLARRAPLPRPAEPTTEIDIEAPPSAGPQVVVRGGALTGARREVAVRSSAGASTTPATGGASATGAATGTTDTVAPSDSAAASQPLPSILTQGTDIGLDGTSSFRIDVAKQLPDENALASENVKRAIMDPIRAHEQQTGDLTSGPLAMALEQTTRRMAGAPMEGRAVFSVEVDELGLVVHVNVSESSGDRRAWDEVARRVLNAFAQKRLHVPPGAKKVAMQIEITSKVALPSGARHPVDVRSPAAQGLERMAQGQFDRPGDTPAIVSGSFDVADIGSHPRRVVGARVLYQETF